MTIEHDINIFSASARMDSIFIVILENSVKLDQYSLGKEKDFFTQIRIIAILVGYANVK